MSKLKREFYARSTVEVAKDLLGKLLVRENDEGKTSGIIIETEAYLGVEDKACHAYGGRITDRTKILFGPVGRAYIYPIYGIYYCLNIVAKEQKVPAGSVLIRAIKPVEGIELMKRRRKCYDLANLTNGLSKLCIAMKIDMNLNNEDMCESKRLYVTDWKKVGNDEICCGKRVNIDYAGECKDWLLRFFIKNV